MRKSIDVTINEQSVPGAVRDYFWDEEKLHPKVFRLTEMSAFAAEEWGARATLALIPRLSREVDPAVAEELRDNTGMLSTYRIGLLLGGISFPEVKDLLKELMSCVQVVTDPGRGLVRPLGLGGAEDIEEVETIYFLREEVLNLHTGFTFAAAIFSLVAALSTSPPSELTPTSRPSSEP